jgi:superfamily II DNA or RNA helicase/HKD family nuclease
MVKKVSEKPHRLKLVDGLYETLISQALESEIARASELGAHVERATLSKAQSPEVLSEYLAKLIEIRIESTNEDDRITLTNQIISQLGLDSILPDGYKKDQITPAESPVLFSVSGVNERGVVNRLVERPVVPLSQSDLLVNGRNEPSLVGSIISEMRSADRIRIIMSFVKYGGLLLLLPDLKRARNRGISIELVTTTYLGETEQRALDKLVEIGVNVRVSHDGRSSRLHAKAWLFERNTGFHTGYVGSSNMSVQAMGEGMEWNVRLSAHETPHLLEKFRATFSTYWNDPNQGFESYNPTLRPQDREKLTRALSRETAYFSATSTQISPLDVTALPFQKEMLTDLDREREVYGHTRNLIVAATGTGKTVVSALDYKRLRQQGSRSRTGRTRPRLLFVSHRETILTQSRNVFRQVLRDANFGELLVGGKSPNSGDHVFASIQTLNAQDRLEKLNPEYFDIVIVDEIHHGAAPSWVELLEHVQPVILLGLTATPERADGADITRFFDNRIATELRLWDALNLDLLAPFHDFAAGNRSLDFTKAKWSDGKYDQEDLTNVYTADRLVMKWIVREIEDKVPNLDAMKAIVFTSSVRYARYVAQQLNDYGFSARALPGTTSQEERDQSFQDLNRGELQAVAAVDILNEGVDIPSVNTVVFLRSTESSAVFLQQLGRGLRKSEDKSFLTILDIVGVHRKEFRFDQRFRAQAGLTKKELGEQVDRGFNSLPAGTSIQLDQVAAELVTANLKASIPSKKSALVTEAHNMATNKGAVEVCFGYFLEELQLPVRGLYAISDASWAQVSHLAEISEIIPTDMDLKLLKSVSRLLHVDDPVRLAAYRELIRNPNAFGDMSMMSTINARTLVMLADFFRPVKSEGNLEQGWRRATSSQVFVEELLQAWAAISQDFVYSTKPLSAEFAHIPLRVHARYTQAEIRAALGAVDREKSSTGFQAGVLHVPQERLDMFLMTWKKDEKSYSPHTM